MWIYGRGAHMGVFSAWCTVEHDGEICTVTFSNDEGSLLLPSHATFPLLHEDIPPNAPTV